MSGPVLRGRTGQLIGKDGAGVVEVDGGHGETPSQAGALPCALLACRGSRGEAPRTGSHRRPDCAYRAGRGPEYCAIHRVCVCEIRKRSGIGAGKAQRHDAK